jgi:hypothetical protein
VKGPRKKGRRWQIDRVNKDGKRGMKRQNEGCCSNKRWCKSGVISGESAEGQLIEGNIGCG